MIAAHTHTMELVVQVNYRSSLSRAKTLLSPRIKILIPDTRAVQLNFTTATNKYQPGPNYIEFLKLKTRKEC